MFEILGRQSLSLEGLFKWSILGNVNKMSDALLVVENNLDVFDYFEITDSASGKSYIIREGGEE